jgi:UDP-N-acetylmuramate dehydrogenase
MLDLPNLQTNVPLAEFTTYKIGGPAEYYVAVHSADELKAAVVAAREAREPYFILGCGANILIRDGGIKGLVIHNLAQHFSIDGNTLMAESGAIVEKLIEATRDVELSGLEHFVGIPSTVGGAMRQNLHFLAPDRERTLYLEEIVQSAEILDEDNTVKTVDRDYFQFGYDDSIIHHKNIVVLSVTFTLTPSTKDAIQKQMDANMEWRIAKQPQLWDYPSCGSVFKKIEGVGAGRLIDDAGLKGTRIGGAEISPKHANYIVNNGGATAKDVLDLIKLAQEKVRQKSGYSIEPEIVIIGEES